MNRPWLHAGIALLLAAGATVLFLQRHRLDARELEQTLAATGAAAPLLFIGLYALGTLLFFPGSVLTLAGGALFGPVLGTLCNLTGATLGAALAFLTARHLASERVERRVGGRLRQLKEGVEAEGWRFVAFVRLVPLFPFNLLNYALGLTRIPFRDYLLASWVAMAPGALAYTWLGHAGREAAAGSETALRSALFALALLATVSFLPRLVRRLRKP